MSETFGEFQVGDDLLFQQESGFGLLRILAIDLDENGEITWHLLAYNEMFPDVEFAELALANPHTLTINLPHIAITNRAFERTPASKLGNRSVTSEELFAVNTWKTLANQIIEDRSAMQLMGFVR
jgi:hypothetical protein